MLMGILGLLLSLSLFSHFIYLLKTGLLIFLENTYSQGVLWAAEGMFGISVLLRRMFIVVFHSCGAAESQDPSTAMLM